MIRSIFLSLSCLGFICLSIYYAYQILLGPLPDTIVTFVSMFLIFGWFVFMFCWQCSYLWFREDLCSVTESIIMASLFSVIFTTPIVGMVSLDYAEYKEPCSQSFEFGETPEHCYSISSGFGELIVEIVPFVLPIGAIAKVGGIGGATKSITRVGNTYK